MLILIFYAKVVVFLSHFVLFRELNETDKETEDIKDLKI